MHRTALFLMLALIVPACSRDSSLQHQRVPLTLDGMAIRVREGSRGFVQSDKRGGFLEGSLQCGSRRASLRWSINGEEILRGMDFVVGDDRRNLAIDSVVIFPHEVLLWLGEGIRVTVSLLDASSDYQHMLAIEMESPSDRSLGISPDPGIPLEFAPIQGGAGFRWSTEQGRVITMSAGRSAATVGKTLIVPPSRTGRFLCCVGSVATPSDSAFEQLPALRDARKQRIGTILQRAYLKTSDDTLSQAMSWLKLSLDALLVESQDTFLVSGVPWDGSISGRVNAESIGGLDFATGEYEKTAGIIRRLALWQDTVAARSTFGRIPSTVSGAIVAYAAADVTPWFVRSLYDHVARTNDTTLVRMLYPVVRRSIDGTLRFHVDERNLLRHGERETWMDPGGRDGNFAAASRGTRAIEVQFLWYNQQMVGSFVANWVGDWKAGERWLALAESTASSFSEAFVDTAQGRVFDHLDARGNGVAESRPNALLCIDILGMSGMQETVLKKVVRSVVYPHGVGTLGADDKRFTPLLEHGGSATAKETRFNGPVWTWLASPLTYALTRFDRQDLSYVVTSWLTHHALERDVAGTLPEMFDVLPRPGASVPQPAGLRASAAAMAEVIQSVYQDYLGVGVDAASRVITLQPKLPDHVKTADFTVFLGTHPVNILYDRTGDIARIAMESAQGTPETKVSIAWMMPGGDAWRGSVKLLPGIPLRIVVAEDDAFAYQGREKVDLAGKLKMRRFSGRPEFSGIEFASPSATLADPQAP